MPLRIFMLPIVALALVAGGLRADRAAAQDPKSYDWAPPTIPNFWDPRARVERQEIPASRTIRFVTSDDFPPLHFAGPDGAPTGFAVELARTVCERLRVACTVQSREFDTLLDALVAGEADVAAAALPLNADLRRDFAATRPYFRFPARFAARRERATPALDVALLEGRTVAVVSGTAHQAYLEAFFPTAQVKPHQNLLLAQIALRDGDVDYLFADGLSLALWLGGRASQECCGFAGGPYVDSRYFGEGIGFVLRPEDEVLKRAVDSTLQRLWDEGKFQELYLRFFPVSPF